MEEALKHIKRPEMRDILAVQSAVLKSLHDYMWKENVFQLMPIMLSPFTDPLNHPVHDSSLDYEGQRLELTKSMILHKQLSLMRDDLKGIYIVSPNIRLELGETGSSGRHLIEFSQVDIELKDADHKAFMSHLEGLYSHIFGFVKDECADPLERLGREVPVSSVPFPVYESTELREQYGEDWEREISLQEKQPFWVMDHYREFYDKEDPATGKHVNYDLIYPEGFGEGLSGAERETDHGVILRKMKERSTDSAQYQTYLEIAKQGLLRPTSGGGFGVERLVRYLCGKKEIREVCMFPRVPGERIAL
jgi:asparaginyl-tRNA synthetase